MSLTAGEFEPMEARQVEALPDEAGWQFEPKWDGFRCLAYRAGGSVELRAKSGKPLGRYFPEVVERLRALKPDRFVLDGELVIPIAGALSFGALQTRLHPAESRVRKLAGETPASLILFDQLLTPEGQALPPEPLSVRRTELERFWAGLGEPAGLALTPYTRDRDEAQGWLDQTGGAVDGVIAKRLDGPYVPGERAMLKVKRLRTVDCVVGGFRYAEGKPEVGSLLLGLYNDRGELDHVGFTSGLSAEERPALTRRLEALVEAPGFTGKAPGGPSRWSTDRSAAWKPLRPELVVEVRYDHVTDDRFRHGTKLVRWRPDKAPRQCRFDQLELGAPAAGPVAAVTQALGSAPQA